MAQLAGAGSTNQRRLQEHALTNPGRAARVALEAWLARVSDSALESDEPLAPIADFLVRGYQRVPIVLQPRG